MEKLRLSLLAVIFGSVFCVLGKTILPLTAGNITPFVFPAAVPLPAWQPQKSRPLAAPIAEIPEYLSGRHYRYIQNDLTLDIEMRYMVNTPGHVKYFIRSIQPSPNQLTLALRQQKAVGFYYLFAHQRRAYLSTCINSRGGSTATESQFQQNRYLYDIHLGRLLPWLLGREAFQDKRCLWAHLSIPLKDSASEDAYQTLEKAWVDWYKWWRPRFPQP